MVTPHIQVMKEKSKAIEKQINLTLGLNTAYVKYPLDENFWLFNSAYNTLQRELEMFVVNYGNLDIFRKRLFFLEPLDPWGYAKILTMINLIDPPALQ